MSTKGLIRGDEIGAYRVLSRLGSGGMGDVYLAEDTRLSRRVALKTLPPALSTDSGALKRLEREARAASALNHPSILIIHDLGRASGITYIATEYVDGETLRARMKRGPIPIREIIDISTQVASALAAADAAGIVHRDIKPENIMIRRDGLVKVLDFGLAKLMESKDVPAPDNSITTETGTVVGTIRYMSPEQMRGQALDGRSDIFSLGCVMYEMIAGRGPFDRESRSDIVAATLTHEPPPPEHPGEAVPSWLQQIVDKALRKNVDERWQSADELLNALNTSTGGTTRAYPVPRPRRRIGRRAIVALGALLIAAAAMAPLVWKARQPPPRIRIAVADFENRTGEKELDGLSGMLITSLEQSRRLQVMSRARMYDILKNLGRDHIDRIDERHGRDIAQEANLRALVTSSISRFGQLYVIELKVLDPSTNEYVFTDKEPGRGQDSIPEMIDRLSERLRLGLDESAKDVREARTEVARATTPNLEAYDHYFRGEQLLNEIDFAGAMEEFQKAVRIDPQFAMAWYRLAFAQEHFGKPAVAQTSVAKARELSDALPEKERLMIEALQAAARGEYARTVELRRRVLKLVPDDKESLFIVGDYSYHGGHYDQALVYLKRVLELDPLYERAHQHLVLTYRDAARHREQLQAAVEYEMKLSTPEALTSKAEALLVNGRVKEAIETAGRVRDDGTDATYFLLPAYFHIAANDMHGALREAERASRSPKQHERFAAAHVRALCAVRQRRYRDAIAIYDEAIQLAPSLPNFTIKEAVLAEKARLLAHVGEGDASRAILTGLTQFGGTLEHEVSAQMMFTWFDLGDVDTASTWATVHAPKYETSQRFVGGHLAMHRGDLNDAIVHFRRLAQLYPDWYPLAKAALKAKRYDEAAHAARRALATSTIGFYGAFERALFQPVADEIFRRQGGAPKR